MESPSPEKIPGSAATRAASSSEDRRDPVGSPTGDAAAPVASVGASFLAARPWIVLPIAVVNAGAMVVWGAPTTQRIAMAAAIIVVVLAFFVEASVVRSRVVSERWLARSLGATVLALALGCALSGGLASPLVPLLGAPMAVAFAAFGRRAPTLALLGLITVVALALALLPTSATFGPPPVGAARIMALASLLGATALAYTGVAGLVSAHAAVAARLDRMRIATLEEAASRIRATEQVGARVAHELKNPLAAIQALLQLLGESELGASDRKRVAVALAETARMDGIVRDYLALKRPLADVEPTRVDLADVARDVAVVLEARAAARAVAIAVTGGPAPLVGDARRLREALLNLTANAVHASPDGGRIDVALAATPDGARATVTDAGPGMDAATLARVGTPFFTTREGGTGLGVAIARAAAEQHGGGISFASRPGGGTVVTMVVRSLADRGAR